MENECAGKREPRCRLHPHYGSLDQTPPYIEPIVYCDRHGAARKMEEALEGLGLYECKVIECQATKAGRLHVRNVEAMPAALAALAQARGEGG